MDLKYIDEKISEIEREIDFYSYLRPLNKEEEKIKFFEALRSGGRYDPRFKYKIADTGDLRAELDKVRGLMNKRGPLEDLLRDKADLLYEKLEFLDSGDMSKKDLSARLYGEPGKECISFSRDILENSFGDNYVFPEENVSPREMASFIQEELDKRVKGWRCVISREIVPKITVFAGDRVVYVNAAAKYTREEIERLKVHEIEVHVYRGANGELQPYRIFSEGLAGYDETEEGLAIEMEERSGSFKTDTRQMKLYAGRALSADLSIRAGFYDVFTEMCRYFPGEIAYRITERVKRGLKDTSSAGAMNKSFHYISGWLKVREHIERGGNLKTLYVGKIGLRDIGTVDLLLSRGVLKEPVHLPEILR